VRVWLRRLVDRALYGDRADPARAVSRLGKQLGSGTHADPEDELTVVCDAMRLPYAALRAGGSERGAHGFGQAATMTGSENSPIRVVLADDHPVVRDGLSALLGSVAGIDVVETASTGREAVRSAVTLRPDVLVLDIQMPDLDGVSAAREITRAAPTVSILMLTMFDGNESVFAAMRAGARGYVLKCATQEEIVRAIRAVAAGEAIFGPGIAMRVLGHLSGSPAASGLFPELTPRAREVLELLAAGLPTTTISSRLGLATKTVINHISAVITKLRVSSRTEAVQQARRAGLGNSPNTRPER
jgi:DNA-binding NarL/FixJ family response regulator